MRGVRAGDLNRKFKLLAPAATQDPETGAESESYMDDGYIWGKWEALSAREFFQAQSIEASVTGKITTYYNEKITPEHRLLSVEEPAANGRTLYIVGVLPDENDNRFMVILFSETKSRGLHVTKVTVNGDIVTFTFNKPVVLAQWTVQNFKVTQVDPPADAFGDVIAQPSAKQISVSSYDLGHTTVGDTWTIVDPPRAVTPKTGTIVAL